MKKLLYLTLFLASSLNAQLLTENFNNFRPSLTITNGAEWWFRANNDSSSVLKDLSGNNHTWEKSASLTLTYPISSVLFSGDSVLFFDGNSPNWFKTVDHDDFDLTTAFSVIIVTKPFDLSQVQDYYLEKDNNNWGLIWEFVANSIEFLASGAAGDNPRTGTAIVLADGWNIVGYTYAGTSQKGYLDGVEQFDSTKTFTLVTSTDSLWVGQSAASANLSKVYIEHLTIVKGVALTAKQIAEYGYLANGWAVAGSDVSGVTRDAFSFHQGIVADTVYYNTVLAAGNWRITVNVDGAAGGESLEVLTSADASTWITLGTIVATTDPINYTIAGSGTGYIGFGLASGTVYIDDVNVFASGDFSLRNLRKDRRLRRLSN